MATSKGYFGRRSHRLLPVCGDTQTHTQSLSLTMDSNFEFEESDLYNSGANSLELRRKPIHQYHAKNKKPSSSPASLPVNVPDWSKILGDDYRDKRMRNSFDDDEDDEEEGGRVPPHEFVARTRMASLSVQEGVGRTLKGRDLRTVRNAIWAKTGFVD